MALIAELETKLTVNSAGFQSGIEKSVGSIQSMISTFAKLAVAGVVFHELKAGVEDFIGKINETTERIAQLYDTSKKLGASVGGFQELEYAAKQSGVSAESLSKSIGFLEKNIGKADEGDKKLIETFEKLGFKVKDLKDMKPEDAFTKIGEAINKLPSQAEKAKDAVQLFSRSGMQNLPLFQRNITELREEFKSFGGELTGAQVTAVKSYAESVNKLTAVWDSFWLQLTAALAGPFQSLVDYITKTTVKMGGMGNVAKSFASAIVSGLAAAVGSFSALIKFVDSAIIKFEQLAIAILRISQIGTLGLSNINLPGGLGGAGDRIASLKDSITARQQSMNDPNSFTNKAQSGLNNLQGQLMQPQKLEVTINASDGLHASVAESPAIRAKINNMIWGNAASAASGVSL